MFNTSDILETLRMIDHQKLDVRTITMGISLLDPASATMSARSADRVYDRIARQRRASGGCWARTLSASSACRSSTSAFP